MSNIMPRKGQKYIIEALNRLNSSKFKLFLSGKCKDEKYMKELRSLIEKYKLEKQVTITGWLNRSSIVKAYQDAHIIVVPSLYEPLGLVIQEAMWLGVPIVASNVGGIPEQVTNNKDALLVPPEDAKSLADAIIKIIKNESLRKQLVLNSLDRVKKMPTYDSFLKKIYDLVVTE